MSAPALMTESTPSPTRAKAAESSEGAMRWGRAVLMRHTVTEPAALFSRAGCIALSRLLSCLPQIPLEIQSSMAFNPFKRSIASYAAEPENNYLLLRFVAALMVIYGHSYAIAKLAGREDLVQWLLHFTYAGGVGVDVFFVISGFLVTASYMNRR